MEILYFDILDSTQKYLTNLVRESKIDREVAVVAKIQRSGVGSRENIWESNIGDLTFSFAIKEENLPSDLPISSASIFFAYIFKEVLHKNSIDCWLKWPNDIYKKNKKIGGVVTQLIKSYYIVGIGLNLTNKNDKYGYIDKNLNVNNMLTSYFMLLKKYKNWQEVFSKFRVEFESQKSFLTHVNGVKKSVENATLCSDGTLIIDNERIYSLR